MCTFSDIWTSLSGPTRQFFTLLTWKCASRHSGMHFFHIWTSKSGPNPSILYTFDLEICFVPQRCALFRHLNFQKWSDLGVFCAFWVGKVLRATTAPHLARWLRTRRFNEPTFRPSGATNHWKKQSESRLSYLSSFFSLFLFSDLLTSWLSPLWLFPPLLFHLSIL